MLPGCGVRKKKVSEADIGRLPKEIIDTVVCNRSRYDGAEVSSVGGGGEESPGSCKMNR